MNRKHKYLVIDTETANSLDDSLVYDLGYAVTDNTGFIYEKQSFVINDIFNLESELMQSAYYAEKIPMYIDRIKKGETRVVDFLLLRWIIKEVIQKYDIKAVCAYNASFDLNALNVTIRYITKSKYRYFFPYGTEIHCIQNMACQVLYTQKRFGKFAVENELFTASGKFLSTSAETGHRYLTKDLTFKEEHTGLADVLIEVNIMAKCYSQHKAMKKNINRGCYWIPQKIHSDLINRSE